MSNRGVSTKNQQAVLRMLKKSLAPTSVYAAQFGVNQGRVGFETAERPGVDKEGRKVIKKYRRLAAARSYGQWDNRQIFFNGLMNKRRNPVFANEEENARMVGIWRRFVDQHLRMKGEGRALELGARWVAKYLLRIIRGHMMRNEDAKGEAKPQQSRKGKVIIANDPASGFKRGAEMDQARRAGYGVYSGQLWESMVIDVRREGQS